MCTLSTFTTCVCVFMLCTPIDSAHVKLPKGFHYCKLQDPEVNRCLLKGAKLAVPELAKGQPKYGIPPIEPLRISTLNIDQGQGSVNIKLNFTDLDINGISQAMIDDVTLDQREPHINIKIRIPVPVILNGTYKIVGKVLVLPINGHGQCKLVLDGFSALAVAHFKPLEKNGELYWNLNHLDFDFSTTKLHIRLDNLFNGDKALGENMNKFLNENWTILLDELRPAFRSALGTVFSEITSRFFERVPITQIFPKQ